MGMWMNNVKMTTQVRKDKLLATLRTNLDRHGAIVKEALAEYVVQARERVLGKLKELEKGRPVTLVFNLSPPQDYSEVYRSTIKMLEWNTAEVVELEADEFRQLVEDKWDWKDGFTASITPYAGGISALWQPT